MNAAHDLSVGVPALATTSRPAPAAPLNFIDFADILVAERTAYIRGVDKERNRFKLHVRTAAFAPKPKNGKERSGIWFFPWANMAYLPKEKRRGR